MKTATITIASGAIQTRIAAALYRLGPRVAQLDRHELTAVVDEVFRKRLP